jgi:uncharacterized protein YkwD
MFSYLVRLSVIFLAPVLQSSDANTKQSEVELVGRQTVHDRLPTLEDLPSKLVDGVKLVEIEANIVTYTNEERVRHGLQPLVVDKDLMATAREHATWMTENQRLVHTSHPVAENIAMGQPTSSDVVQAWMNSPGHRANILNGSHGRIGVAAFRTESGVIYWCQQFQQ